MKRFQLEHNREILFNKTNNKMESKLFFFLFFIFIFSLTFSSKEKEDKQKKTKINILNLHARCMTDDFQNARCLTDDFRNTLNFVQPNSDYIQNSNTKNFKPHVKFSDLSNTNEAKNAKVPSDFLKTQEKEKFSDLSNTNEAKNAKVPDFLKTQEKENSNIHVDLLKKNKAAKRSNVSCGLLKIKLDVVPYICAYLSLFELELNFKCVSTEIYNLYENFLQEEKNLLTEEYLNNKVKFGTHIRNSINCASDHFDFFEKRLWSKPDRIEYANVNSFSKNLFLFPKSTRQIVCFQFHEIEYKYVLFKDGHLLILKKLNKEKNFVFTSLENDFTTSLPSFNKTHKMQLQENIRWMEFDDRTDRSYLKIGVNLHKTDNFKQLILHDENYKKIVIHDPVHEEGQKVFLKDITGYLQLKKNGCVTLKRLVKQSNEKHKLTEFATFTFRGNVKAIKSKDFEHYLEDFQPFAKDVLFLFNKKTNDENIYL